MRTKTGVLGMCLALGTLVVSSANTKTAEAHSGLTTPAQHVELQPTQPAASPSASTSSVVADVAPTPQASAPLVAPLEIITPPPADLRLENPKLRRMRTEEISKGMLEAAAKLVHKHHAKPVGTQIEVEVDGQRVVARIERHFHPEGGPVKPWGFHPGVSLFAPR